MKISLFLCLSFLGLSYSFNIKEDNIVGNLQIKNRNLIDKRQKEFQLNFIVDGVSYQSTVTNQHERFHKVDNILKFKGDEYGSKIIERGFTLNSIGSGEALQTSITFARNGLVTGHLFMNEKSYHFEANQDVHNRTLFDSEGYFEISVLIKSVLFDTDKFKINDRILRTRDDSIERFEDCYAGDEEAHFLDIGIATDLSYTLSFSNEAAAINEIESFVSSTNVVFASQLNIFLNLKQVIIINVGDSIPSDFQFFGAVSDTCFDTAETLLLNFKEWVKRVPSTGNSEIEAVQQAEWHLITSCFDFGFVGSAFVRSDENGARGTLCDFALGTNSAVTSLTSRGFVSFAHEIGHNIGADHSFENGQGTTGGLMDDGDGLVDGVVQFRSARKNEICEGLTNALKKCGSKFRSFSGECAFNDFCSNGVCENGICIEMEYVFIIDNSEDFTFVLADPSLTLGVAVPNLISRTNYVLQADNPGEDPFACTEAGTRASEDFALLVVVDNFELGSNCTYFERAKSIKVRGFSGAILYNPTLPADEVITMTLTDEEREAGSEPVDDFFMAYVSESVASTLVIPGISLEITFGWVDFPNQRLFDVHNNFVVPEEESKFNEIIPKLIIFPTIVAVIVIIGILILYRNKEEVVRRLTSSLNMSRSGDEMLAAVKQIEAEDAALFKA